MRHTGHLQSFFKFQRNAYLLCIHAFTSLQGLSSQCRQVRPHPRELVVADTTANVTVIVPSTERRVLQN